MGSSYDEYMDDYEQSRFDPASFSVIDRIDRMYSDKNMVSVGFWREVRPEIEAMQEEITRLRAQLGEANSPKLKFQGLSFLQNIIEGLKYIRMYLGIEEEGVQHPLVGHADNMAFELLLLCKNRGLIPDTDEWLQPTTHPTPQARVPDGYALVPIEPTDEMLTSAMGEWDSRHKGGERNFMAMLGHCYQAMLKSQGGD